VLALLGFVATDFIITITLSAADATAHVLENPFAPAWIAHERIGVTLFLIAVLGAVFLKGFREAVGIAVVLVTAYLSLNAVVVARGFYEVANHPETLRHWERALSTSHGGSMLQMVGISVLLFPKLALGLSGFETGVAVMPLIRGVGHSSGARLNHRIRNTRMLLRTAAAIMSVFLLSTSFITSLLIPHAEFADGGKANGRALAYLAHQFFGSGFGTVYDFSTILILWFAGASAMAGLLNIVPRYLPRYGMAPDWARAVRPLVLVYVAIAVAVTLIFRADVNAQGGAYATGVLVLMTSAAIAVTIAVHRKGQLRSTIAFGAISLVFAYTTVANVFERPDGIKIAAFFITAIVLVSLVSRAFRSLELRVNNVELDDEAKKLLDEAARSDQLIRIVANYPEERNVVEYRREDQKVREDHEIPNDAPVMFFEVYTTDPSEFSATLKVHGVDCEGYKVLRGYGTAVPNAIAAFLLYVRDATGKRPHVYFNWTEGSPIHHLVRYLLSGQGEIAPLTREILRQAEPDKDQRPAVHAAI
jgi:preprotein translocase subunit SecG